MYMTGYGPWAMGYSRSIEEAVDEPGLGAALGEQAVRGPVGERDVPLVALACANRQVRRGAKRRRPVAPAVAPATPRRRRRVVATTRQATPVGDYAHVPALLDGDARRHRRPE